MALKVLLLRKKQRDKEAELSALRAQLAGYKTREGELAAQIEAATTDEEQAAVTEAVTALEAEQSAAQAAISAIETALAELKTAIDEAEAAAAAAAAGGEDDPPEDDPPGARNRRNAMPNRDQAARERRAAELVRTGRMTVPNARALLRSTLLSTSTGVVGPTGVGGINDLHEVQVGSLIDMIKVTDCTGMSSYKVAYVATATADAAAISPEGSVPTQAEPTFGAITLAPTDYGTLAYVSKEIKKQTPLLYESKVTDYARTALRKKLSALAVDAIKASALNTTHALETESGTATYTFTEHLLSDIILSYGGDEGVEGAAVLLCNKADLKAFAAVRGTNEYLPVYSIVPDATNPNTGVIKDNNGLSCRYSINKHVTALSTATLTTTPVKTMLYGNPQCCEMAIWGGAEVAVSEDYKFGEGLMTVRGEVTADVDVTVQHGFVVVTAAQAS